ncbi:Myotilin [Dissostichus eleginoides]|uniref:Myotilin n=1 Tax=Dissostichus eleginoides TaxID=100907 RepID=A0AAD9FFW8_DISEL|nr:Myotilin [Dissostichus eleginoides]
MWYREDEQVLDSDDFRILRKKASSASVPEELCTLVITEAFPEDSGIFKCVVINPFGTVSCSAILEVYNDLEEQLEVEAASQQVAASLRQEQEAMFHQETFSDDFPSELPDSMTLPPPEWPESPPEDNSPVADFPEPQLAYYCSEEPFGRSEEERALSSEGQRLTFTSSQPGGNSTNMSDLPSFTPSVFPPSAFNYERPRHFIQSQAAFQAPSYESVLKEAHENQNNSQQNLISSQHVTETQSQAKVMSAQSQSFSQTQSVSKSMSQTQAQFQSLSLSQNQTHIPSATGLGSATLPANQDSMSAPAAFLCSVLPSPSAFSPFSSSKLSPNSSLPHPSISPSHSQLSPFPSPLPQQHLPVSPSLPRSPLSPSSPSSFPQPNTPNGQSRVPPAVVSLPASYKAAPSILPKPILKKAVAPRPSSSRSTDDDIQGSKDALIQDLEKKLRSKEKLSYEERMARRLLGPDNANYMFDQDGLSDSQLDQPEAPEGRHTGGLWGRRHTGTDERGNEGSAIQEKSYAPRFLQIPLDLTVEEGRFCRIDFKVGGLPTPDVCWYLDGKAIRPDDYHKMLVCEKGMHSFIIEIVTVHHAGVYECEARNRAGESRFTMRLDVLAQEALRPPTFVQKMLNSRVLEGDTVRLECKVDASPPPQLHWKKDKDMLRIDPNRMSLYEDGSGRQCLLIERLMKSDAGWYTLSAINEAGMSTCNARLDVGTRTAPKTAPPGSKTLKLLSSLKHVPSLTVETPTQHTAPLYESEEL